MKGPERSEAGTASIELLFVATALLALLRLTAIAGRVTGADADVAAAARDGARAATLTRSRAAARHAADEAVRATLARQQLICGRLTVRTDLRQWRPGGLVTVTVGCTVDLRDVTVPGAPKSMRLNSAEDAPLDPNRTVTA